MDIQLEKKKGLQKKHIPYVAGGVLFVILLGWIIFGDHASTLKVDARGISIGNVTREQFNDFFRMVRCNLSRSCSLAPRRAVSYRRKSWKRVPK